MAEQVTSWLAKAVVEHDRINGSNLKIEKNNIKRLVQINTVDPAVIDYGN